MNEWVGERDEERKLEAAFTFGNGSTESPQPATDYCEPKPQAPAERPRRRKAISRQGLGGRKSDISSRRSARRNALVQKIVATHGIPIADTKNSEQRSLGETDAGAGSKRPCDFPSMLKRAMKSKVQEVGSLRILEAEDSDTSQKEREAEFKLAGQEKRERSWSLRIVVRLPTGLRMETVRRRLASAWNWARKQTKCRQAKKRLHVRETVSLGEKRFVAVIEVDGKHFLLGGAQNSVTAIARLEPSEQISDVLDPRWVQDAVQA